MSSEDKRKKRLKKLSSCVKYNDLKRLKYYIKRRKYSKLNLTSAVVNKKRETLLHFACRQCKPNIVTFLLKNHICDTAASDQNRNTALHSALKSVLKIVEKEQFIEAYKNLILLHLNGFATSMDQSNDDGLTVGFLLETADAIYRHHTREIPKKIHHDAEEDWNSKICAEMEDEYQNNWGQYEEDFLEADVNDCETYDSWAERMIYEHRKKTSNHSYKVPPAPKVESKSSSGWSAEDQSQFLKNEETKRIAKEAEKSSKLRFQFLSKLRNMVHSEGTIHSTDLPFDCQDQVECICQHILFDVKEVNDVEEKRKAVRELKRLWHPDKFAQKFHQRLAEDIKDPVMKKVNEIAQYLNTYNC